MTAATRVMDATRPMGHNEGQHPAATAPAPPRLRYGQYEIEVPPLGEGGMGVVYRAKHTVLQRVHCIKVLLPEFTRKPDVVQRFVNEAMAVAKLRHAHIVGVFDCAQTEDGVWYIVLEYLAGVSLADWLGGKAEHGVTPALAWPGVPGAVAITQVVHILAQVASALHAAHQGDIVHRDVKPDNIFLVANRVIGRRDGHHAILLDFGIAKLRDSELTRTGSGIGTPAYMAPEQLANAKQVDHRADVYALGAIAFKMLTGRHAWANEAGDLVSPSEIYRRQTTESPPDPRLWNPALSARVASVLRRALACSPIERWASAVEFIRAFAETLDADGTNPGGGDILATYAPDVWDPDDPFWGQRNLLPPLPSVADHAWQPPPTAVSATDEYAALAPGPDAATRPGRRAGPASSSGRAVAHAVATVKPTGARQGRRRVFGFALAGVAGAMVIAAIVVGMGGASNRSRPSIAGGDQPQPATPRAVVAGPTTAFAVLTSPPGATVFVDDELMDEQALAKLALAAGRRVRIRVELPGYTSSEATHTVGTTPQTVRLDLTPIASAILDAGTDAPLPAKPRTRPQTGVTNTPPPKVSTDDIVQ